MMVLFTTKIEGSLREGSTLHKLSIVSRQSIDVGTFLFAMRILRSAFFLSGRSKLSGIYFLYLPIHTAHVIHSTTGVLFGSIQCIKKDQNKASVVFCKLLCGT
mmetsp:Transcript_41396/g.70868  ORF Transcript_41396/g.70868 Transcript_41396/m.70868 type:complete len:103 (-) Transcript_41396:397-705(-)